MIIAIGRLILTGACFICFAPIFILGQESGAVTELDPGVTISVDLPRHFRADLYVGRERSDEIGAAKDKVGAGISFRMKPRFKRLLDAIDSDKQHLLVLGAIYEYSVASEQNETSREHKLMLDATLRYDLPHKFLLSDRNRLELRWVNGDYHLRYRNRPAVERSFRNFKRDITPYLAAEFFWDQRYRKVNMYKFSAGVQVPLYRRTSLEFFYERQHCTTCGSENTNIFGLNFYVALSLKKK